ncbi:hypothetical protein [Streptomyces hainanensis]|uniref:hypothetical protein n=1 Tax=Streptomyces hainanensis TaxID=402648 RepID=UPI001405088B|nr:hypothetical protein [Streptomyces hainanensis]
MSTSPPQETTTPPAGAAEAAGARPAADVPDAGAPALVIVGSDTAPVCQDGVCHL